MAKLVIFLALCLISVVTAMPVKENSPAEFARYLMSKTNWVSLATISTISEIENYPFNNVKSSADGNSGIPYLFFSDLDLSVIDLNANPRASLLATFADTECKELGYDPQDPRCPRLILSGRILKLDDPEETVFAKNALYTKHPDMKFWETVHDFYIVKLDIERVTYLGNFGGADIINVDDYFSANPANVKQM